MTVDKKIRVLEKKTLKILLIIPLHSWALDRVQFFDRKRKIRAVNTYRATYQRQVLPTCDVHYSFLGALRKIAESDY
jgi:hypothetical protein